MPPAVRISPSPAIASVVTPTTMPVGDAGHHIGVAGLADAGDAAVLDADVGLADAGPVDDQRVGDDAVERARRRRRRPPAPCRRAAPCRRRTCTRRRRRWRRARLRRRAPCRRGERGRRSSGRRCRRSGADRSDGSWPLSCRSPIACSLTPAARARPSSVTGRLRAARCRRESTRRPAIATRLTSSSRPARTAPRCRPECRAACRRRRARSKASARLVSMK